MSPPLGCLACAGPEEFGSILDLSLGPGGDLVVLDRDPPHIRVFDRVGASTAAFGRRGEGPGELRRPNGVAWREDGGIVVADFRRQALVVFGTDGEVDETLPLDGIAADLAGDPAGRWLSWQEPDWTTMTAGVRLLAPDGSLLHPLPSTTERVFDRNGEPAAMGLFASVPGPDGRLAVVDVHAYRVLILAPDASEIATFGRDVARARRTPEEIEQIRERMSRGPGGRGRPNPEAGATPPEIDPLRPHLLVGGAAFDARGRLWLLTGRGEQAGTIIDVFDVDGTFLGQVEVATSLRTLTIGGGVLAGVSEDPESGVDLVMRWQIGR